MRNIRHGFAQTFSPVYVSRDQCFIEFSERFGEVGVIEGKGKRANLGTARHVPRDGFVDVIMCDAEFVSCLLGGDVAMQERRTLALCFGNRNAVTLGGGQHVRGGKRLAHVVKQSGDGGALRVDADCAGDAPHGLGDGDTVAHAVLAEALSQARDELIRAWNVQRTHDKGLVVE